MPAFRRVEAEAAGPQALGILIPPARRTFVILRPRALPWDLLLCRDGADPLFRDLAHDEASAAAQSLFRALGVGARIETISTQSGSFVRAVAGPFVLVACVRQPGRPYSPAVCSADEACAVVAQLRPVLCPPVGVEQELYFNVRFFERPA